ncbi:MAG: chromosomal replication initiator protein DnaA [Planctomycetes bacterium]|nr:chromosomal replication initiator protein DnaA [Planctomycetota bacterium]
MSSNLPDAGVSLKLKSVVSESSRFKPLSPWLNRLSVVSHNDESITFSLLDSSLNDLFTEDIKNLLQEAVHHNSEKKPFVKIDLFSTYSLKSQEPNSALHFDNLYVGGSNKLAIAAAKEVSVNPGTYNPLFIHAGIGIGKTHILNAIANKIQETSPDKNILFLSAKYYLHNFMRAVECNNLAKFRDTILSSDILIIDDFHHFAEHKSCQMEFINIFNQLHNKNAQLVFSSLLEPSSIPFLSNELASRLQWGLVVEMDNPSANMRKSIIKSKSEQAGFEVPENAIEFIANNTFGPVRELEGLLNSLRSRAVLLNENIDISLVQKLLKTSSRRPSSTITLEQVEKFICAHFSISHEDMVSKTRMRSIAFPRQVAMFLAQTMTSASLEEIGRHFGGRDHSTVKHGAEKVREQMKNDSTLRALVADFRKTVNK